jgi:hypothetical protein
MAWKKDKHVYTFKNLEGKVASDVLSAPRTSGDLTGEWPQVHSRVIGYVVRNVLGKPWADHLTLMASVLCAQRRDVWTVESILRTIHPRFSSLFSLFKLDDVHQWTIDQHFVPYLRGEVLPQDPLPTRISFLKRYMSATNLVVSWFDFLPADQQDRYRPFLLPTINPFLAEEFHRMEKEWERQQQDHRKQETEAVVPEFTALRAEAHFRYNRMARLWQAYQQAISQVLPDHSNLPLEFSYEEGEPPVERFAFRLWDRRSFVLHPEHASQYHHDTVGSARRHQRQFTDTHNEVFLELIKTERLMDDAPVEGLWFTDILKRGVLGSKARLGTEQELAEKQGWLRQWGYGEDNPKEAVSPFEAYHHGLLTWPDASSTGRSIATFIFEAQRRTDGTLIPVESLSAATTFGLLALELLTTTGMYVMWNLKNSLHNRHYVDLTLDSSAFLRATSGNST